MQRNSTWAMRLGQLEVLERSMPVIGQYSDQHDAHWLNLILLEMHASKTFPPKHKEDTQIRKAAQIWFFWPKLLRVSYSTSNYQ